MLERIVEILRKKIDYEYCQSDKALREKNYKDHYIHKGKVQCLQETIGMIEAGEPMLALWEDILK